VQDATARPVLQLQMLSRTFRQGDREIPVLKGASADLYPGQAVALVGPSGAASRRCCTSRACSRRPTAARHRQRRGLLAPQRY
jgi:lipoprotein-releasing system ATP-binding protein